MTMVRQITSVMTNKQRYSGLLFGVTESVVKIMTESVDSVQIE